MKQLLCKAFRTLLAGVTLTVVAASAAAQIQVTSANPNNAAQGTVNLNVVVNGNGFKKGATAKWFISGTTNPGGVTVNSTAFNSSGQLTANITVAADAYVGGFDIVVTNADGRSGKGTELFAVNSGGGATGNLTITATLYNDNGSTPYTLQSDGSPSAVYSNTKGAGVTSDLTPTANNPVDYFQWDLDLSKSSELFYVTLQPNDSASGTAAPFTGPVGFHGVLHSRCFTSSGGYQDWTKIQPGYPDGNCAMRVNFTYGSASYTLVMSPDTAGTGTATVTCTQWGTLSGSCIGWTDVPNSSAANPNVAYLYNTSHGQTYVGSYSLSFSVTLTQP